MNENVFINKGDFIESISETDEYDNGLIKFNIPDHEVRYKTTNGEGVWGWCTPEDKARYDDDKCHDTIKAILLNNPLNYMGIIQWGDELQIRCNGNSRASLDPEWMDQKLKEMGYDVYIEMTEI